jgi:hypothetical protein
MSWLGELVLAMTTGFILKPNHFATFSKLFCSLKRILISHSYPTLPYPSRYVWYIPSLLDTQNKSGNVNVYRWLHNDIPIMNLGRVNVRLVDSTKWVSQVQRIFAHIDSLNEPVALILAQMVSIIGRGMRQKVNVVQGQVTHGHVKSELRTTTTICTLTDNH